MKLLDFMNLVHLKIYSLEKNEIELNLDNIRKSLINGIMWLDNRIPGQMVICKDSFNNWRKEIFPQYKANRKINRDKDDKDWDSIFDSLNIIYNELKNESNYICVEVAGLEADDVIAILSKNLKKSTTILSSDRDLNQLINNKTQQYNLLSGEYYSFDDVDLQTKILKGDSGDGVPNIFSNDNHFLTEDKQRQKSITKDIINNCYDRASTYKYMIEHNEDVDNIMKNYDRNNTTINLNCIPQKYINLVKSEYVDSAKQISIRDKLLFQLYIKKNNIEVPE